MKIVNRKTKGDFFLLKKKEKGDKKQKRNKTIECEQQNNKDWRESRQAALSPVQIDQSKKK